MKKFLLTLTIAASMCAMTSCGGSNAGNAEDSARQAESASAVAAQEAAKAQQDSIEAARQDSIKLAEEAKAVEEADIAVINKVYTYVFTWNESAIKQLLSPAVISRMKAANEYDDGSMNLRVLTTDNQDGPSDVSKVNNVVAEGDGWYKVSFTEMGTKGTKRVKVADGKIADYK